MDGLEEEAEQVDSAGVVSIETLSVPGLSFQFPLDTFAIISGSKSDPPLFDHLVHLCRELQLRLFADFGAGKVHEFILGTILQCFFFVLNGITVV